MTIVPPKRPELPRELALDLLKQHGVQVPAILGRRGYYRDTMGQPGANDIGIYDDAIAVVTPTEYRCFNANTDPSRHFPGVAVLKAGVWAYKLGMHNLSKPPSERYPALVQAAPVTVAREQRGDDTGWFGINIHRGSLHSTSSLGCQTIYPEQWQQFFAFVRAVMQRHKIDAIPYLLTERGSA